jgi:hypothetical protein
VTTATLPDVHWWNRVTSDGRPWWIADESPGILGDPEVWIDESAMDMYGRGDAAPAVTVTGERDYEAPGGNWWFGAVIRFTRHPGLTAPAVYQVTCRRWSTANNGRPFYVAKWPD